MGYGGSRSAQKVNTGTGTARQGRRNWDGELGGPREWGRIGRGQITTDSEAGPKIGHYTGAVSAAWGRAVQMYAEMHGNLSIGENGFIREGPRWAGQNFD